jgi:saccharopine dehydrogenase-like NADP-dependent oxidoreductase
MTNRILIIGGRGRIGTSVAQDILTHTDAEITVAVILNALFRLDSPSDRVQYLALNLAVHCAGPFHYRDASVLKTCIEAGVNYTDVSDSRSFTSRALAYRETAKNAGVTAIVNTGIFPGISNSMVRRDVEQLDTA